MSLVASTTVDAALDLASLTGRPGLLAQRDLMIQRMKDLQRSVDYVETRSDLDRQRLAFYTLYDGGHVFPFARIMKDTLEWLDRYLDPVK